MKRWVALAAVAAAAAVGHAASLPQQIVDRVASACVLIQVNEGKTASTGSGFFVGRSEIVTNYHVVKGAVEAAGQVTVVLGRDAKDRKIAQADVVAADKDLDLALLRTPEKSSTTLTFLPEKSLRVTQAVWVAGFPFGAKAGLEVTMTAGTISSLRHNDKGKLELVQIDAAVNPGNSGGPVVDDAGRIVGVSRAMIDPKMGSGMALAIPCSVAKAFADTAQRVRRRTEALRVSGRALRRGVRVLGAEKVEEPGGTNVRVTVRGARGVEEVQPFTVRITGSDREVLKSHEIDARDLRLHEEKTYTIRLRGVSFSDVAACEIRD